MSNGNSRSFWRFLYDPGLSRLSYSLSAVSQAPAHIYVVYIRTRPERLWAAITEPEYTPFEGTILEAQPPRRLVYTFHYVGDAATQPEQPSRVTWEIEQIGDACKLTVVHDQFAPGELKTYRRVDGGWPFILSSLKTYVETGQALSSRVG